MLVWISRAITLTRTCHIPNSPVNRGRKNCEQSLEAQNVQTLLPPLTLSLTAKFWSFRVLGLLKFHLIGHLRDLFHKWFKELQEKRKKWIAFAPPPPPFVLWLDLKRIFPLIASCLARLASDTKRQKHFFFHFMIFTLVIFFDSVPRLFAWKVPLKKYEGFHNGRLFAISCRE